ncbi:Hypothetical predicted protein, partial [Podarcis lilfordi]
ELAQETLNSLNYTSAQRMQRVQKTRSKACQNQELSLLSRLHSAVEQTGKNAKI